MTRPLYFTLAQLRARIRLEILLQALDFDHKGQIADSTPSFVSLAEAVCTEIDEILGAPQGTFPVPFAAAPSTPNAVNEIALDLMECRVAKKVPTALVMDYKDVEKKARERLEELRTGWRGTGQKPPDPAANTGGAIFPSMPGVPRMGRPPIFGPKKWGIY